MLRITILTALLLTAPVSQAADNGIYLGAGVTQSELDLDNPLNARPFDEKDGGYKLIVGWRPIDNFGVEANYIDHGDATLPAGISCTDFITTPCPDTTRLSTRTASAFAVGYLDFPLLDLFGKVGVTAWQFDGHSTPAFSGFEIDADSVEVAWGVGVQARFGSFGARLEYEKFSIIDDEEVGTVSLSVTYTFL